MAYRVSRRGFGKALAGAALAPALPALRAHAAEPLKIRIGWGSMPEEMVRDDIREGRLVRLAVTAWDNAIYRLQTIYRTNSPPGPATRWLMDRLKETLAQP